MQQQKARRSRVDEPNRNVVAPEKATVTNNARPSLEGRQCVEKCA